MTIWQNEHAQYLRSCFRFLREPNFSLSAQTFKTVVNATKANGTEMSQLLDLSLVERCVAIYDQIRNERPADQIEWGEFAIGNIEEWERNLRVRIIGSLCQGPSTTPHDELKAGTLGISDEPPEKVNLAFPPGHFYSPIVDPVEAGPFLKNVARDVRSLPGLSVDAEAMILLWRSFAAYLTQKPFPDSRGESGRFWFDNPAFSYGDATVLYCMLRRFKPARIIEVGSGYSSACMLETAERFSPDPVTFTFIDPHPKLLEELIGNLNQRVRVLPKAIQDVEPTLFDDLAENDILFIDSTHVLKTGSDVCVELFEILPRLRPGVLVHFHDVFWPFEYGMEWVVTENRSWNELYALRAFLSSTTLLKFCFSTIISAASTLPRSRTFAPGSSRIRAARCGCVGADCRFGVIHAPATGNGNAGRR